MRKLHSTLGMATPVIACVNQKGGVGKSTLTTLLANHFYFRKELRIAILDADFPQHSIYKRRVENASYICSKPWLKKLTLELYQERKPIQVFHLPITEVGQSIASIQNDFDLIFLDIAGTLNQEGIQEAFAHVHFFFIPVLLDEDTLRSSLEFFQIVSQNFFAKSEVFKACYFLLNKISSLSTALAYRQKIEATGATVFPSLVHSHVVYERTFRSTLLPIPKADEKKLYHKEILRLQGFAEEIYQTVMESFSRHNSAAIPNAARDKSAAQS